MKCSVCGSEIPDGQKFCPVCGCAVSAAAAADSIKNQDAFSGSNFGSPGSPVSSSYSQPGYAGQSQGIRNGTIPESAWQTTGTGYKTGFRVWAGIISAVNIVIALQNLSVLAELNKPGYSLFGMDSMKPMLVMAAIGGSAYAIGYLLLAMQKGKWQNVMYIILAGLICAMIADFMMLNFPGVEAGATFATDFTAAGILIFFWYMFSSGKAMK